MNYTRFLNAISRARKPSPIRALSDILARSPPSLISLAPGAPNPALFPFESAEIKLRDGSKLVLDKGKMMKALQYGPSQGDVNLVAHLKKLTHHMHSPPSMDRGAEQGGLEDCVTVGSQDGISKSFEMLVSPGDNIIIDSPTYAGTLAIIHPLGCNILSAETDHHGMIPDSLRKVLSPWKPADAQDPESNIPRVLYTIPNGVNPTGASLSAERKKQIYKIAREYDLLILEDDPYFFLQFQEPRIPSFLSMDQDGRVLRFDSFSKVLSSGLRVGFVSGPQPLVSRLILHMMSSVMHVPSMSQHMVGELFDKWGIEGFEEHVGKVVDFYRNQKDSMIECADKWLGGLAEWDEPTAGMFLWLRLKGVEDTKKLIMEKALKKEVLLVPGCAFMADSDAPCPYVRASYSLASYEQMDKGFERLASLIREEATSQ